MSEVDGIVLHVLWTGLVAILLPVGAQIMWLMGVGLAFWARALLVDA